MSESEKVNMSELGQALGATHEYATSASRGYDYGGNYSRTFNPHSGATSVRSETTARDYEQFRPAERIPTCPYEAMEMANDAYKKVGIVYRVINLYSDFTTAGMSLEHPIRAHKKIFNDWWKKVRGQERSSQFVNYLQRLGNVVVYKDYGTVPTKQKGGVYDGMARLPMHYSFINPIDVTPLGERLSTFIKEPVYVLYIHSFVKNLYSELSGTNVDNKEKLVKEIVAQFPKQIQEALKNNAKYIVLPKENTSVFHYKKDDWSHIAYPMTYPVLDNVLDLEKMHLADRSALDGAISNVRLWKLGYIDPKNPNNFALPSSNAFAKIRDVLSNNVIGGVIDVIWGPDIEFKESNTSVYHFLTPEKYTQVMYELYEGLGIPATLTGRGGSSASYNNNYLSMKTMTTNLEYLRNTLLEFWEPQLKEVANTLGIKPPKLRFENVNFSDESVMNKLILDLIDRDLIDAETALEEFNFLPEIVKKRLIKQQRDRDNGKMPEKAGPYHNPQYENDFIKIGMQKDLITPSEVGLNLEERKQGEKTRYEMEMEKVKQTTNNSSPSENTMPQNPGRPSGSKDSEKRKPKNTLKASAILWGEDAQNKIDEILLPVVLANYGISNARKFTNEQRRSYEKLKLAVFCSIESGSSVSKELVYNILEESPKISSRINEYINQGVEECFSNDKMPTLSDLIKINSIAHAKYSEEK